jgi:predicted MFS family arabinose efflux permease
MAGAVAVDATRAEAAVATTGGGLSRSRGRRLLTGLAITQTIGYGVLYYAFSVFLTPIAVDLHTGVTAVTAALTLSVVLAGIVGVPIGWWIDRHGGRGLMTVGSLLGALAVAAWSQVHTVAELYAVFAVIGLASAMSLYEPAFAVIVSRFPAGRRTGALLTVTVVAGFASSIFLPTAGLLTAHLGWRHTALTLAAVLLVVTVPLHAFALPPGRADAAAQPDDGRPRNSTRAALADRGFWLLVIGFTAQGAAVAVIGVHLVTYLTRLGHPPAFAATIAGLLGVLSVTGRIVTSGLHRRHPIARITAFVFLGQAVGIAALPLIGRSTVGAMGCVTVLGLGFGVATIARPALLADRYGTDSYATISGSMKLPISAAGAAAPLAGAAIASSAAGYTTLMLAVAAACAVAALSLILLGDRQRVIRCQPRSVTRLTTNT